MEIQRAVKHRVLEICEMQNLEADQFIILMDESCDTPMEEIEAFCFVSNTSLADFFQSDLFRK